MAATMDRTLELGDVISSPPENEQESDAEAPKFVGTIRMYHKLNETADLGKTKTRTYSSSSYKLQQRVPDTLTDVTLPGVSPFAGRLSQTATSRPPSTSEDTINLHELKDWYGEQQDKKKYSLGEWKECNTYVRGVSRQRQRSSMTALSISEHKRGSVSKTLAQRHLATTNSIQSRIKGVDAFKQRIKNAQEGTMRQIDLLTKAINELIHYINTKFSWPRKCNLACFQLRDQRIGIDKVLDKVEVALNKERDMLESIAAKNLEPVLLLAQATLEELKSVYQRLTEDRDRKSASTSVDHNAVHLAHREQDLQLYAEEVQARPTTAISLEQWEKDGQAMLDWTKAVISEASKVRKQMKSEIGKCTEAVAKQQAAIEKTFKRSRARSEKAVATTEHILKQTRDEIGVVDNEIEQLVQAIEEQEVPLKYATSRLKERSKRPDAERTIDMAHRRLIEEIAELEGAVRTLTDELDTNERNRIDLGNMVAMLEEDLTIKKNTLSLEERCIKTRSYLAPDVDPYFIHRLMTDDGFFIAHTH
eukprot:m.184833 g.184833  ORF g.184833 m.184833 type:complete len:533 (-) comp32209_c0_seq1:95-1693(-)